MASAQYWSRVIRWTPTRRRIGSIANAWEEAVLECAVIALGLSGVQIDARLRVQEVVRRPKD